MHARTERMHAGVRFCFCVLVLMLCSAFMAAALPHYRQLQKMRHELSDVQVSEEEVLDRVDGKTRELDAIRNDKEYREIIARDRLNYYIPGEHIFRIDDESRK